MNPNQWYHNPDESGEPKEEEGLDKAALTRQSRWCGVLVRLRPRILWRKRVRAVWKLPVFNSCNGNRRTSSSGGSGVVANSRAVGQCSVGFEGPYGPRWRTDLNRKCVYSLSDAGGSWNVARKGFSTNDGGLSFHTICGCKRWKPCLHCANSNHVTSNIPRMADYVPHLHVLEGCKG